MVGTLRGLDSLDIRTDGTLHADISGNKADQKASQVVHSRLVQASRMHLHGRDVCRSESLEGDYWGGDAAATKSS